MRALFLALLFANLALYAWWRYGVPEDAAPAPLSRQIAPDKLKVVAPANLPPVAAATKPPPSPPVSAPAAAASCLEWGRSEEQAGWWVFIPPQADRQSALRKAAELKQLGIEDYFVVQEDGAYRWALSLGVFRTEEAAQARLAALRGLGVRTARLGARETVVPKVWLQVKGVDAPLQLRLREIARQVEGSELKDCP